MSWRTRDLVQDLPRASGVLSCPWPIAQDGLTHLGERFAGDEVDDFIELEALVGLTPAKDRNLDHTYISLSTLSANREREFCFNAIGYRVGRVFKQKLDRNHSIQP